MFNVVGVNCLPLRGGLLESVTSLIGLWLQFAPCISLGINKILPTPKKLQGLVTICEVVTWYVSLEDEFAT